MTANNTPHAEFERTLTGGHPNSLGNTVDVVESVLADRSRLPDLYSCYFSPDEVVRLRVSSAMKRVARVEPSWLVPFLDGLLGEIADIRQASTQWTLAWIVLNTTMDVLGEWAASDAALTRWLLPRLERLQQDPRRSVANRARKLHTKLRA